MSQPVHIAVPLSIIRLRQTDRQGFSSFLLQVDLHFLKTCDRIA